MSDIYQYCLRLPPYVLHVSVRLYLLDVFDPNIDSGCDAQNLGCLGFEKTHDLPFIRNVYCDFNFDHGVIYNLLEIYKP